MPPWALTYWKYAFADGAISLYPGAATPVSGWWLPIRIWDLVMPGADAVLVVPEPDPLLPLEPHAAATSARAAATATTPTRRRLGDLFMAHLLPSVHWPARAGAEY